jgi:hypothetical protein
VLALCFVEHTPGGSEQEEAVPNEQAAEEMQGMQVRIAAPAKQGIPQMPHVVG